jgi:hypothetical protein
MSIVTTIFKAFASPITIWTSDEARRIANGMMQRKDFYQSGNGQYRWKKSRSYHVALEDGYIRAHGGFINTVCKMTSIPFDGTGELIQRDGTWCVFEFAVQLDTFSFGIALTGDGFAGKSSFGSAERFAATSRAV